MNIKNHRTSIHGMIERSLCAYVDRGADGDNVASSKAIRDLKAS